MTETTAAAAGRTETVSCEKCGHPAGKRSGMGLMMLLCCVLPMVAVMAILGLAMMGFLQVDALRGGGLTIAMILLCPLMMGGMMVAMWLSHRKAAGKDGHGCH